MANRAFRLDFSEGISAVETLGDGSIRIPARISRTGVQVYKRTDGTEQREYRPPEEVFSADSVSTWTDMALTVGHPIQPVTPDTWPQLAVGHVAAPAPDGDYLGAKAIAKDSATIKRIKDKELVEISAGYFLDIDYTPGVTPAGEKYDAIQRNIRGNHVALLPRGAGRAGPDVRLYTGDAADGTAGGAQRGDVAYGIRYDASTGASLPGYPSGMSTPANTPAPAEKVVPFSEHEKTLARADAAEAELARVKTSQTHADAAVKNGIALRMAAKELAPSIAFIRKDGDKEVMLTDREIMVNAIVSRHKSFTADGRGDDYVRARFDIECENAAKDASERSTVRTDSRSGPGFDAVKALAKDGPQADIKQDASKTKIDIAKDSMKKRLADAWKSPGKMDKRK